MTAPWAPMIAPPLPCRNDVERNTCEHAYPRELCRGSWHLPDPIEVKLRHYYGSVALNPYPIFGTVTS